jgi:hypothetical protein
MSDLIEEWGTYHQRPGAQRLYKNVPQVVVDNTHRSHGQPEPMSTWHNPVPCPWIVAAFVEAVGVQQLAASLPEGSARTQLQSRADAAIAQVLIDYCGTPPRLVPWPWPGPPPWVYEIASDLTTIAYTMEGSMRAGLLQVAGQVVGAAASRSA